METGRIIHDLMREKLPHIADTVDFIYIEPYLKEKGVFTDLTLERAKTGGKINLDIMAALVYDMRRMDQAGFYLFLDVLSVDYSELAEELRHDFHNCSRSSSRREIQSPKPASRETVAEVTSINNISESMELFGLKAPDICQFVEPSNGVASTSSPTSLSPYAASGGSGSQGLTECRHTDMTAPNPEPSHSNCSQQYPDQTTYPPGTSSDQPASHPGNKQTTGFAEMVALQYVVNSNGSVLSTSSPLGLAPAGMSKYDQIIAENPGRVFPMDTKPRGVALIIDNQEFSHLPRRNWSEIDRGNLHSMFQSFLGFKVSVEKNKNAEDILRYLKTFSKYDGLKSASALAVVILSHGGSNDILFGADGQITDAVPVMHTFISKFQIMDIFKQENCPDMKGKPKMFIIQSCRGHEDDLVHQHEGDVVDGHLIRSNFTLKSGHEYCGSRQIAAMSDMCFVHSSSLGYKAYRTESEGSPFVHTLVQYVRSYAATMEFRDIIREVQNTMKSSPLKNKFISLPDFSCQLTNDWYLNPPSDAQQVSTSTP